MTNFINDIEITNFKSIRHQKIDGCKRINVFIGYPNVGKSNILEALSSLSYWERDYYVPFSKLCRIESASELFNDANIQEKAIIKWSHFKTEFIYISEKLFEILLEDSLDDYPKSLKNIKFNMNSIENSSSRLSKNVLSVKKYQYNDTFNVERSSGLSLSAPFGENLFDVIQLNSSIRKEVLDIFKVYGYELTFEKATNSLKVLKRLEDGTLLILPFNLVSDTLQRFIFYKAAIASNYNSVLLFEEPESHMFPPYISNFTQDIIQNENSNQFFLATHSPFVINDLLEDARDDISIYTVGYKNGETTIKRLTEKELHDIYQYGIDLFFNLESYLADA